MNVDNNQYIQKTNQSHVVTYQNFSIVLVVEVGKYHLNGLSTNKKNDIFKFWRNVYNFRNFDNVYSGNHQTNEYEKYYVAYGACQESQTTMNQLQKSCFQNWQITQWGSCYSFRLSSLKSTSHFTYGEVWLCKNSC